MIALIFTRPSIEGGPDVEHLVGVFSCDEKADEAQTSFTRYMEKEHVKNIDNRQFVRWKDVKGLWCSGSDWDFHGECQSEIMDFADHPNKLELTDDNDNEDAEYWVRQCELDQIYYE